MKKRYVVVGLGNRGPGMFVKPLVNQYSDVAELVGICDINPHRLELVRNELGNTVPAFTSFEQMLDEVQCDVVIIATPCGTHHEFIISALDRDLDVITEKAMTIDAEKTRAILAAEARSKGKLTVTFNYRFAPYVTAVKQLLKDGAVGDIHSVEFHWYLDTLHGADYYRRWHRRKENSGGLLVHKATHHFDLINWFTDAEPQMVFATGQRHFYGSNRPSPSERCLNCPAADTCEFYLDMKQNGFMRRVYLEAEKHDGYLRDRCVFSPDINIEDTMHVVAKYTKGIQLSYTLTSATPFEGWTMVVNGSKGRLEANEAHSFIPTEERVFSERVKAAKPIDAAQAAAGLFDPADEQTIRVYPLYGGVEAHTVPKASGGHGGGDSRLRDMLFRENVPDPLGHAADSWAGVVSVLLGVAANNSIATGLPVNIADLLGEEFTPAAWRTA
jgi:predicted dehydrogenase